MPSMEIGPPFLDNFQCLLEDSQRFCFRSLLGKWFKCLFSFHYIYFKILFKDPFCLTLALYVKKSCTDGRESPIFSITQCTLLFPSSSPSTPVTTKEPVLFTPINSMPSFHLISRLPLPQHPFSLPGSHAITVRTHSSFTSSGLLQSLGLSLSLMTLTVPRSTSQAFGRMSLNRGFTVMGFLIIRLRLQHLR